MREYGVVTCEHWLINISTAGKMNHLVRCINLNRMSATSATIFLGLAGAGIEWTVHYNGCQLSNNDCWSRKWGNWIVICLLLCITDKLAAFIGQSDSDMISNPFWNKASMEHQQCLRLHLGLPKWELVENIHKRGTGHLSRLQQY